MVIPKINSEHGAETRNIINAVIDSINVQGKSIQDLVAEGQLTPTQYAELITIINSNLKSGEVGEFDLTPELRLEVNRVSDKINKGEVTESDITGSLQSLVNSIPNKINRGEATFDDIDINQGKLLPKHASEELLSMITGDAPINAVPADGSITSHKLASDSVEDKHIKGLDTTINEINSTVETFNKNNSSIPFSVVDSHGKSAIEVDDNGLTNLNIKAANGDFKTYDSEGNENLVINSEDIHYEFSVVDNSGRVLFGVNSEGELLVPSVETSNINVETINGEIPNNSTSGTKVKPAELDSEINMFIAYGQSWAQGYDAQAISTAQEYDSIMLNTGVKNYSIMDMSVTATHFEPLIEQNGYHNLEGTGQMAGETPTYGQTAMVKQLLKEENNIGIDDVDYQLLGTSPGRGSASLQMLAKGTDFYKRLIDQVRVANSIAEGMNKRLKVQAFSWAQSSSSGVYHEELERLRSDIDADVKGITGQTKNVKCITWQNFPIASGGAESSYERYVKASELHEDIICSGATYHLDYINPGVNLHFTSESSAWLGAYFGIAYKRTINDLEKFVPLKPINIEYHNKSLYVKFNVPQAPLKFDTDRVSLAENYGFSVRTSTGEDRVIESVDIVNLDTIKIVTESEIQSSDFLWYADNSDGDKWGRRTGLRGNLRDSQGDHIVYDRNGLELPMHNWCVAFKKSIGQ